MFLPREALVVYLRVMDIKDEAVKEDDLWTNRAALDYNQKEEVEQYPICTVSHKEVYERLLINHNL